MIFSVISFFVIGVCAGLVTALPIGPTNLWLIHASLPPGRPRKNILAFVFGLIMLDVIYASMAFLGYSYLQQHSSYAGVVGATAGIGLLIIGIAGVASSVSYDYEAELVMLADGPPTSRSRDFLTGILLGANPAYIAYWLGVAQMTERYAGESLGSWSFGVVFVGIVAGDVLWYSIFLRVLRRIVSRVSPRFVKTSRLVIGILFIVFGAMVLGEFSS